MVCKLCNFDKYKVIFKAKSDFLNKNYLITDHHSQHGQIVQCLNCGLIFVYPQPRKEEILTKYISSQDELYLKEKKGRIKTCQNILKKISYYKKGGKLLDVGCYTGILLEVAKENGWEPYGIELSDWAVNEAKKNGLNVFQGEFEEKNVIFPDNFFDCLSLNDYLEHSFDPNQTIKICYRLLKRGGLLFINTPNIESFFAKFLKENWWGITETHLYYFSPKTIKILLSQHNFKIVKIKSHLCYFSFEYLLMTAFKKNSLNPLISKIKLNKLIFPINFKDRIEIYAFKK